MFNPIEAEHLVEYYKLMRRNYKNLEIGIISPYQKQVAHIVKLIDEK